MLDGKPLPVGGYTKDPHADYRYGAGMMAKGYKLHPAWSDRALPDEWAVTSLGEGEANCRRTRTTTRAGGSTRPQRRATSC